MNHRMSPRRHRSRAQAMVEFALVAPLFFLFLFGIIEAGRFIYYYEMLNNATREGARYAIVNGASTIGCPSGPPAPGSTSCDVPGNNVIARVRKSAIGIAGTINVTATWDGTPPSNARGSTVTVTADTTYKTLVPFVPLPQITVSAESSLVINN